VFQKLLKADDDSDGTSSGGRSPSKPGRRSLSAREVSRPRRGGLHAGLISAPQNDLRHTLHVGCDGSTFGDLSKFISQDQTPAAPVDSAPGMKVTIPLSGFTLKFYYLLVIIWFCFHSCIYSLTVHFSWH